MQLRRPLIAKNLHCFDVVGDGFALPHGRLKDVGWTPSSVQIATRKGLDECFQVRFSRFSAIHGENVEETFGRSFRRGQETRAEHCETRDELWKTRAELCVNRSGGEPFLTVAQINRLLANAGFVTGASFQTQFAV
jgi:hypothetical protein